MKGLLFWNGIFRLYGTNTTFQGMSIVKSINEGRNNTQNWQNHVAKAIFHFSIFKVYMNFQHIQKLFTVLWLQSRQMPVTFKYIAY